MDMEATARFYTAFAPRGDSFFVEVALWDIVGKAVGLPLYRLWGGKQDRVRVYASTVHHGRTPAERAEDCLAYLARGYKAVKLRLSAPTMAEDIALVETCRAAIGNRMADFMVDANQEGQDARADEPGVCWDLARAQETARRLAEETLPTSKSRCPTGLSQRGSLCVRAPSSLSPEEKETRYSCL